MKQLLMSYIKVFVTLIFFTGLLSCSNDNEFKLKLTEEQLVGTMWEVKILRVEKASNPPYNYYLNNYYTGICVFRRDGVFKYTDLVETENYGISNEIFYMEGQAFKIAKFTGDYIELISEEGLIGDIARNSGYGFRIKYELRKI